MKKTNDIKARFTNARGVSAVEYALLVAAIAIGVGAVTRAVGKSVNKNMQDAVTTLDQR